MSRRERAVSRQLGCVRCRGCGSGVLFHGTEGDLECPSCGTTTRVPKAITADLEHGRKLPIDLHGESRRALDGAVETHYEGFALRARWILLAGALGAAYFAVDYHASAARPEWTDYLIGAGLGFFCIALPLGWTLSWFEGTGIGRASDQSERWLRKQASVCPSCKHPFFGDDTPGTFACTKCGTPVAYTPELSVPAEGERAEAFAKAALTELKGAPWLSARRSLVPYVMLVVVGLSTALCLHSALHL